MKSDLRVWFAAAALVACTGAGAAGIVEVKFTQPEQYSDAGRTAMERQRNLQALQAHLKQLGGRLPDGQTLTIEVFDVDLAGELQPGSRRDVRVLRGRADWPRIKLAYTLQAGGSTLASGNETVQDMDYLDWPPRSNGDDELPYEKHMLTEWFQQRFVHPQPQ